MPTNAKLSFADYFGLNFDLRFHFILPIPAQDLNEQTPLFGFTPDVLAAIKSLRTILFLPQHPWEISARREEVLWSRMSGSTYQLFPIPLLALEHLTFDYRTPLVCFLTNESTYEKVRIYRSALQVPTLQVRVPLSRSDLQIGDLCELLEAVRNFHRNAGNPEMTSALNTVRPQKRSWSKQPLSISRHNHFTILANEFALDSFGFEFAGESQLIGQDNRPYVDAIAKSCDEVLQQRQLALSGQKGTRAAPLTLILTVPGFYKHVYGRIHIPKGRFAPALKAFKRYAKQRDYFIRAPATEVQELLQSEEARFITRLYQEEIEAYSLSVATKAVNHFAPTIRLPPALNHLGSEMDKIARSARSNSPHIAFKQNKLMRQIKIKLRDLVPEEFISRIDDPTNVIKLIADAPLEWIPLRGLPLMLRNDTSRIPTTPGNLLFQLCASPGEMLTTVEILQKVLIVRSYAADDPIRHLLPTALGSFTRENLKIQIAEVENDTEFVEAFRQSDAGIAIFDGHGAPATLRSSGKIFLGKQPVDVYALRGQFQPPPIVVLSACDTHSFDTSHASVANSFLLLGARTVLGTTLPLDARHAALFLGRFLHRLDQYLPLMRTTLDQPVRWITVMAGLQRMMYVTELREFLKQKRILRLPRGADRGLAAQANWPVVQGRSDWFEQVITIFAEAANVTREELIQTIDADFNLSEALKYVQLGNPEQILILSQTAEKIFLEPPQAHLQRAPG